MQAPAVPRNTDAGRPLLDLDARRAQGLQRLLQEVGAGPVQQHVAAGDGRRHGIGPGLDAVGQHGMLGAVQRLASLDPQGRRAEPLDPGAHPDQAVGESTTSGSRAAFSIRLSPRASTAAIKALWVAPTETLDSVTLLPVSPRGARAMT